MTMPDVAREAGVSAMTVSYAFNHPQRVAEATRRRVLDAAERLGYSGPHPGARSLRRGRTGTLGVVLGEHLTYAFDDPQATQFLGGVSSVCVEHELGLTLLPVTGGPSDAARIREAAVDALILWTSADDDPVLDAVLQRGLPAVVHGGPAREGLGLIGIDDRAAARAVGAAAFTGARAPAVLSFPTGRDRQPRLLRGPAPDAARFSVTRHRLQGYADAASAAGLDWARIPVLVLARNDRAEAEAATQRLLQDSETPVDAIAAMSDELALGALAAAHRLDRSIPAQLAVTGWDDTPAAAAAGLTTIAQSLRHQGELCARSVIEPGAAPAQAQNAPVWQLVHRASTHGSPPADDVSRAH
ncbi:DNA-binding LacI/PurR family transcriptional regulator [Kineococcus xinjiangensis]|uniref:DNA-binding LacI/PurR family transcriptional regulator n=1 Tax=Kineococcus xinjiangensis TaxID=512762 RepID=A0A2S6IE04_9ACTN|nr:DNA-binding LacI/PurR family transcriptional regulator [Kineococcus xinjiangensis]